MACACVVALAMRAEGSSPYYEPCGPQQKLFQIRHANRLGFIDGVGRVVVRPRFNSVGPFSQALASADFQGQLVFINESAEAVFRVPGIYPGKFSEDLSDVRVGELWGFVDKTGKFVIEPQFTFVTPFHEGIAMVKDQSGQRAIDKKGRTIFALPSDGSREVFGWFSEGRAVAFDGRHSGYIGVDGQWIIQAQYDRAEDFSGGLAAVEVGKKWGYINRSGRFVIEPRFVSAGPFSEALAPVQVLEGDGRVSRLGFIDTSGRIVIELRFNQVGLFCSGLSPVEVDGKWGYADRSGTMVIAPAFEEAGSFAGELAQVVVKDKRGHHREAYIDKAGRVVWCSTENVVLVD